MVNIRKIFKYFSVFILFFIGLQIMNRFLILIGNRFMQIVSFRSETEVLIVGIIQQLIQLSLAIILTNVLLKKDLYCLGFNLKNLRSSLRFFLCFALLIVVVIVVYDTIISQLFPLLWEELKNSSTPTASELSLKIFFQSIFPGLGEESLFRGFLITFLVSNFQLDVDERKSRIFLALFSGLLFSIAHIYYQIDPFRITHLDINQLSLAFFSGIFYSLMYMKTKSLVGPILSHNFSNVAMTVSSYIVAII